MISTPARSCEECRSPVATRDASWPGFSHQVGCFRIEAFRKNAIPACPCCDAIHVLAAHPRCAASSDDPGERPSAGIRRSTTAFCWRNYFFPDDLETQIDAFVANYNICAITRASTI